MEKSYFLRMDSSYRTIDKLPKNLSYPIQHAEQQYWQSPHNLVGEQTFDGRYGYLYYYECWITQAERFTVETLRGDLHLLYSLHLGTTLRAVGQSTDFVYDLARESGRYIYFPKGEYEFHFSVGHHLIIGFILDAGLFRPPANRLLHFIAPLVEAKRANSPLPIKTADFRANGSTLSHLLQLFTKINPYTLQTEHILLRYLIFLIDLSRFKFPDKTAPDQHLLIHDARSLLESFIQQQGARATIKTIAEELQCPATVLSRAHRKIFGCSFQTYRNQLLLDLIEQVILQHDKQAVTAYETGFAGPSEMNRFIRQFTGMTAAQFKDDVLQRLHR